MNLQCKCKKYVPRTMKMLLQKNYNGIFYKRFCVVAFLNINISVQGKESEKLHIVRP